MPRGVNDYDTAKLQGRNVSNADSSIIVSPGLITDSLLLYVDAGNFVSYPASGTSFYDLSGGRNTGTLVNGPTYSQDGGGSLVFDGTNDYVEIPTSLVMPGTTSFTISFWSKSAKKSGGNFNAFISNRTLTNPFAGVLITQDFTVGRENYLRVQLNTNSSVAQYNSGTLPMTNNVFCNVSISVDRVYNVMRWYVNAVFDSEYSLVGLGNISSANQLDLGRDEAFAPNANAYLTGSIAQVLIHNRALTPTEVQQNFNATRARFGI